MRSAPLTDAASEAALPHLEKPDEEKSKKLPAPRHFSIFKRRHDTF